MYFRTVSFLTYNFYISRGKASNIDSLSNIGESINNDDATGNDNDQSESEASGTSPTLISVLNVCQSGLRRNQKCRSNM